MERSLNRLARLWTYKIQGLPVGAWIGLILLVAAFVAGTDISVDGIVGIALMTAFAAAWLSWWAVAISAAVFSANRTNYVLKRLHSPELVRRSIAGVVAIVVGFGVLLSLLVLFFACAPRVGE